MFVCQSGAESIENIRERRSKKYIRKSSKIILVKQHLLQIAAVHRNYINSFKKINMRRCSKSTAAS